MIKAEKVYNYNIRCKICKKGFNPKDRQNAYTAICPQCYKKNSFKRAEKGVND